MSGVENRNVRFANRALFFISVLISGSVAGAFIWAVLFVMNTGLTAIWDRIPVYLGDLYPLIVCTVGGLVIGLFARRFGEYPDTLNEVMAKVRRDGRYEYDRIGTMSVGAVLPLVFGGSVGPEAGLTGIIAALCTWVSDRFRRFGGEIRSLTQAGMYATISAVFAAPLFGAAGVAEDQHRLHRGEGSFVQRILTYAFATGGAFAALLVLSHFAGTGMSMPYYSDIVYGRDEFLWLVPVCLIGAFAGWMFCILDRLFHRLSVRIGGRRVVKPVVAGFILGLCGVFLPLTMFSGEVQSEELNGTWTTFVPAVLLLIGFVKIAVTALCVNMGWRGGHFFPVIFAGISIGYGLSAILCIDPVFAVCASTAATVGGVMRRPLMAVMLLFLCFPIHSVFVLALAAVIGSLMPVPKSLAYEDEAAVPNDRRYRHPFNIRRPSCRCMDRSDSHLESMLEELNDRVSTLEDGGSPQDLVQAYVNRGSVLYMMDYRTSAMEDFESASELTDRMGSVDPVTYLRIHCSIASLLFSQGDDPSEEYWNASTRLSEIGPDSPYFDRRSLARVFISTIEELIDSGHPDDCEPFISKGLEMVSGNDAWSRNRRVEIWNLSGEADDDRNDPSSAIDSYTGAVNEAISLMENGLLEDSATLVLSLSMRAAAETDLKRDEDAVRDLEAAISILEGLLEHHSLPDTEPLVDLHHDLAGALIRVGRTDEAERHLIRAMEMGISRSVSDSDRDGFSD